MSEAVIIAIITGACSVVAVILTNIQSNKRVEQALVTSQAVTDVKIEELTREVRSHNDFGRRIPVIENTLENVNRRLDDLERRV